MNVGEIEPAELQWGVLWPSGHVSLCDSEEEARRMAGDAWIDLEPPQVVVREVTAWGAAWSTMPNSIR